MPVVSSDTVSGFVPHCEDFCSTVVTSRAGCVVPDTVSGGAPHCEDFVHLFEAVFASGKCNYVGSRIPVPSKLHIGRWKELLKDYHKDPLLVDMLEFGFPLDVQGEVPVCSDHRNHKGARDHALEVSRYVRKEIDLGRLAGPFDGNPLSVHLHTSPLNTVPKDESERRVISDLSWPIGSSVNDFISKTVYLEEEICLHYVSVEEICDLVRKVGVGALVYKRDLKKAYRQIPVDPRDYRYLGYNWEGKMLMDTVLCMGQRNAAMACQRTTDGVMYIHNRRGHEGAPYLDDLIGVSPPKAAPPSSSQVVMGVLINTVDMTISVPPERMAELHIMLPQWLSKQRCSKVELQSLLGLLCYVVKCVRQSRVFLNRLLCDLRCFKSGVQSIRLSSDFRKDIKWWLRFMDKYNGVSFIPQPDWHAPDVVFATDSTLGGCGGLTSDEYFHASFPSFILDQCLDINCLEILGVVVAVRLWGEFYAGRRILLYCDNLQAVIAINSGRTRSDFMGKCVRQLWLEVASHEFQLKAVHLPGEENRLADSLSRWELSPYYKHLFMQQTLGIPMLERSVCSELFLINDDF